MKAPSTSYAGPALLLAMFVVGGLVGRGLAVPLPSAVAWLVLVLLGLRVGVMLAAVAEPMPEPVQPAGRRAHAARPALHVANG